MHTIIIGAGASGLASAIEIKRLLPDSRVTILEKNEYPGKKLYATGGGRCNLSNLKSKYHKITESFFKSIGIPFRYDSEGRAYPYCEKAEAVVKSLENECAKLGVIILCENKVKKVEKEDYCFTVYTQNNILFCDKVILSCGGKAQRNLGGDISGYEIAKSMGHTVTPLSPGLVQLTSSSRRIKRLDGLRAKCHVDIEVDGEIKGNDTGEVLFTNYGLSGIVIMNLSCLVSCFFLSKSEHRCMALIDFIPDMSIKDVQDYINNYGDLVGLVGSQINDLIFDEVKNDVLKAAEYAKHQRVIITGTKGFDFAQVTCGGIPIRETENFKSKKCSGLYICGEMLDQQYECGGFNLSFAFASGLIAAGEIYSEVSNDKNK